MCRSQATDTTAAATAGLALGDPVRFLRYGQQHTVAAWRCCFDFTSFETFGQLICVTCETPRLSHSGPRHHDAVPQPCKLFLTCGRAPNGCSRDETREAAVARRAGADTKIKEVT